VYKEEKIHGGVVIYNDKLKVKIDFITKDFFYKGETEPGVLDSDNKWRISRTVTTQPGGDITILWADANANFDKIWDDRAEYIYG
jgi:hypothetical protein